MMTVDQRPWYEREKEAILYGQSARFRVIKYLILAVLLGALYVWNGWAAIAWFFGVTLPLSLAVHFFFRWKTYGWRHSWWLYRKPTSIKNMPDSL